MHAEIILIFNHEALNISPLNFQEISYIVFYIQRLSNLLIMFSTISHLVITFDIEVKSSDAAPVTGLIVVVGPILSSLSPNAFCRPYINLSHNNTDRFRS